MNFDALVPVHNFAKRAHVSWSLHYAESDDSWYFVVSSSAPSECFVGKNRSLHTAAADVVEHLKGILAQ